MNAKIGARRIASKLQRAFMMVLVLVVMFGSLPISRAHAWAYVTPVIGRPGPVSVPNIYIGDLIMPSGYRAFTLYGQTGPIVYRSPAPSGIQTVAAQYLVERWDGYKWVMSAKAGPFYGTIGVTSGAKFQFPAPYIQPVLARGTFRITWSFSWVAGTSSLGAVVVRPNLKDDHLCVTPYRLCKTSPGYFQTGLNNTTW